MLTSNLFFGTGASFFCVETEELVPKLEPAQNQHRPGFGGKGVLAVLGVTSYKVTDYSNDISIIGNEVK